MGVGNNVSMQKYIVYVNEQNNYQIVANYGRIYSL